VASVSTLGEPVGATILAYFIFGEVPSPLQLVGDYIILTGLYIFITSQRKPEAQPLGHSIQEAGRS